MVGTLSAMLEHIASTQPGAGIDDTTSLLERIGQLDAEEQEELSQFISACFNFHCGLAVVQNLHQLLLAYLAYADALSVETQLQKCVTDKEPAKVGILDVIERTAKASISVRTAHITLLQSLPAEACLESELGVSALLRRGVAIALRTQQVMTHRN